MNRLSFLLKSIAGAFQEQTAAGVPRDVPREAAPAGHPQELISNGNGTLGPWVYDHISPVCFSELFKSMEKSPSGAGCGWEVPALEFRDGEGGMLSVVESTGVKEEAFPEALRAKRLGISAEIPIWDAPAPSATASIASECRHRESLQGSKDLTRQEERPQGGAVNLVGA